MTRIKLLTFAVSFLLLFSTIATVFGRGGLVVNAVLRQEVDEMRREREKKEAEVQLLRDSLESCGSEEEDSGDAVFIASLPTSVRMSAVPATQDSTEITVNGGFEGLSHAIILLASLAGAIITTIIVSLLPPVRRAERSRNAGRRRVSENTERRGGPSSYDDIDTV